ncbi:uncharacterized protein GIQ15_03049 [Arthroderma uncinatum]|uniref:uncharacterized protein n=1 Tax=Arthroderma uncinatum TaxID=74035 RepID=UPI00144ABCEA|nr:uncharacterized protein GIQ15_03049 [Arthroderma uncinatum]KAF3483725.1 hypothetical protein GIQ15_03049 [Arthroderma uncinatum]
MEVWSGPIDSGSTTPLTGIRLIDPNSTSQSGLSKNAKLSFRAYVNPNRIPIFCFTGPCLETEETDYEAFTSVQQCPVGILIRVEQQPSSNEVNISSSQYAISDILIFGALSASGSQHIRPPTPQPSSAAAGDRLCEDGGATHELRVYAIPLCSDIITKARALATPPFSPQYNPAGASENEPSGEFLPDFFRSPSPKRKRVATLFEAAAEYHKKVRRKGAAAMSDFITRDKSVTPQFPQLPSCIKIKRENENNATLSGSFGDISLARRRATSIARDARAGSRRPSLSRPSSSMSQALSTSSHKDLPSSRAGDLNHPPERHQKPGSPDLISLEDITAANKALLTRTILTCMRLYGFRRTNTRTTSCLPSSMPAMRDQSSLPISDDTLSKHDADEPNEGRSHDNSEYTTLRQPGGLRKRDAPIAGDVFDGRELTKAEAEGEDDTGFKDMYHATYRASAFALRRFFKPSTPAIRVPGDASASHTYHLPTLKKDKAMDTVDSVLKLFCELSDAE